MMECGAMVASRKSSMLFRVTAVLFAALACVGILTLAIVPSAHAAAETVTGTSNTAGTTLLTSTDGAVVYKITTAASSSAAGAVQLQSVSSARTGDYSIADTVTSNYRNYQYQVTSLDGAAFVNASSLTSLSIPSTVTCSSLRLYGCTALQSVSVDAANASLSVGAEGMLYNKDGSTIIACPPNLQVGKLTVSATVKSIASYAFCNNTKLTSVEFTADLTGDTPAVGSYAFSGCTALESVTFPQKVAGIGSYAFSGCTALESVTFPEKAELYSTSTGSRAAIAKGAFEGCSSLESIKIPVVTSTARSGDYYYTFEEYNPSSNVDAALQTRWTSGYGVVTASFWDGAPTPYVAIDTEVFKNCTSLKSILFEAGANQGMFSYLYGQQVAFEGCTSLQSVVYEAEQPYWADQNRSLFGGNFIDLWEKCGIGTPTQYYAVDYYATSGAAESDDAAANNRLTRVEYKRGTSTSDIASGNTEALVDYVYADREAYAQKETDGIVPDAAAAKQAAVNVGLDTADSSKVWAWKLDDTQSRREGLTDSCSAYLVEVDDISAGRIDADQITTMYKLCDQNLSQGSVQDTAFDPERYYANSESDPYWFTSDSEYSGGKLSLDEGETAWFTLSSSTEESFYNKIKVRAADGTELDPADYAITFQRYDATTGSYVDAELGQADGPLLMTVTPSEESGYTGTLQEWVLVEGHAGSVLEQFTDNVESTWQAACHYKSNNFWNISFTSPYAVAISSADTSSALVAAGYAGLVQAPISVVDTKNDSYGFGMTTDFYSSSGEIKGTLMSFSAEGFDTPAAFAVATYQAFDGKRDGLGASSSKYPWGDTAVLVAPGSVSDVAASAAAYAYAKKAPVFYAEDDSSVSDDTLACLKDFSKVVVIGDTTQFSDEAFSAVTSSLGAEVAVTRINGDTGSASALSLAVADTLASEGLATSSVVTVSDATEAADAISALNLSGHESGLTLVSSCTADSKRISAYLRDKRNAVNTVRLYGRDASNISSDSFDFLASLQDIWDEAGYAQPVVSEGDTLVLNGVLFNVGADNTLEFTGTRLWGTADLDAGTYTYGGVGYVLSEGTGSAVDPDPNPDPDPDPEPSPDPNPDPGQDTGSTTKPGGSLTIGDTSQGNISVGTSGSGSNPSTGTIEVSLPSDDETGQPNDPAEEDTDNPVVSDPVDNPSDPDPGEDSPTSASPVAAVTLIVVALGALGAALWFAVRKRKPATLLTE